MLHKKRGTNRIDRKCLGHLRRIEIPPAFLGHDLFAMQKARGIDHQSNFTYELSDVPGRTRDAALVGQLKDWPSAAPETNGS